MPVHPNFPQVPTCLGTFGPTSTLGEILRPRNLDKYVMPFNSKIIIIIIINTGKS